MLWVRKDLGEERIFLGGGVTKEAWRFKLVFGPKHLDLRNRFGIAAFQTGSSVALSRDLQD
jgi:hypothetical protein